MSTQYIQRAASPSADEAQPTPFEAEHRFQYRGWEVTVQIDGMADGCVAGHAQLNAGNYSCRLVLAGRHHDGSAAIDALDRKARALIDDREALAALSQRNVGPRASADQAGA
ncbi:hypothetical protein [Variovorax sp. KK3]|uniref:hypothetical protein n=1 Tax=Variovorax sp. KK3 TaxID=1855728 RepID=UPI00097BFFC2|nr:hypothetical protein [Variovorax sp. KK3]